MENMPRPYPFGLEGAISTYQNTVHHLFIDHVKHGHVNDLSLYSPKCKWPYRTFGGFRLYNFCNVLI
jgi:hypothetical protein